MESRHKTPSVMAKLMGLDKEPPQNPVREKQRVLSDKYLQKVASIGFSKKHSSHQHNSLRMSIEEKEEFGEVLKVVKTIQRDENHKMSTRNGKQYPELLDVKQQLSDAETLIGPISAFNIETGVKSGTIMEQGNQQLPQEISTGMQRNVHGENKLYEMSRFPKSQPESKDGPFPSRIIVLKPHDGKGESSLKCFSLSTCESYRLGNGLLNNFFCPKNSILYSGMKERKKLADHMESTKQSPRAFINVSDEVSSQTGDDTKGVPDMDSRSSFRGNGTCGKSSEMLNPVSIVDPRSRTENDTLHKYWGSRQDAYLNSSPQQSEKQDTNKKGYSKLMSLRFSSEKLKFLLSYSFNSNHNEDNCISLHKLKKKFYGNGLSDQKPMLPELSDTQLKQQACLLKDEVKNNKLEHSNISKQNIASLDSSIHVQVADEKSEAVGRPCGSPKNQQPETTACILLEDNDSSSHTSYASIEEEDDSVYSFCSETQLDSLGSSEEAYEPSPISVLEPPFRENISFSSQCLSVAGDDSCDSSEMDKEERLHLNVSSDEDCMDGSVGDFEEKQDFVGFLRAEESRNFSYVVEVLTEAGISNRSLYTDFHSWHSPQCPISPFVFENLEMKFGKQPSWERSDRKLLFDRINSALPEILQPCICIPAWEMPVSRRLNAELSQEMIEEELWDLLVVQEKEAKKESADKMLVGDINWIELRYDIENTVSEIVTFLIEELAEEIVSLESF